LIPLIVVHYTGSLKRADIVSDPGGGGFSVLLVAYLKAEVLDDTTPAKERM
jgi:hypothetical protein